WGPCREDAVSLQGAAAPAGDGRGESGVHSLCQDAAVCPSLDRQQRGSNHRGSQGHAPAWSKGCHCSGYSPPWVGPLLPAGLRLLPPARTTNRILCESNIRLRSAQTLSLHRDPPAVSPAEEGQVRHPLGRGGGQGCGVPSPRGRRADRPGCPGLPCLHTQLWRPQHTGSHQHLAPREPLEPEATEPPGPRLGGAGAPPRSMTAPHLHLSHQGWERREEPAPPCPMYQLVLEGDGGTGKSSFLLRLCNNEFRGDISSTLGVDFQIKQLLVDGEQTTLQIWDTAGQER
ncbi:RASEF protein, partial [Rhinoptilus africanus]|nr:RASEF protein [Rhinoptilus africanus]